MKKTKNEVSERWYAVDGYDGRYQVSTQGHVRSSAPLNGHGSTRQPWRVLKAAKRPNGRQYVLLCLEGVDRWYCVSFLMAQAYRIPNPRGCGYVIHKNRDNLDFRRTNLAWATLAEMRMHDGNKLNSQYLGVYRAGGPVAPGGGVLRWVARLVVNNENHWLGLFPTPEEAAYAYDREVKRLGLSRPLNGLKKPAAYRPKIESLPGEVWRPFPGVKESHKISNLGRVCNGAYRDPSGRRVLPKLLKVKTSPRGIRTLQIRGQRYNVTQILARVFPTEAGRPRRTDDSSAAAEHTKPARNSPSAN